MVELAQGFVHHGAVQVSILMNSDSSGRQFAKQATKQGLIVACLKSLVHAAKRCQYRFRCMIFHRLSSLQVDSGLDYTELLEI
jgi:hypothetical protein